MQGLPWNRRYLKGASRPETDGFQMCEPPVPQAMLRSHQRCRLLSWVLTLGPKVVFSLKDTDFHFASVHLKKAAMFLHHVHIEPYTFHSLHNFTLVTIFRAICFQLTVFIQWSVYSLWPFDVFYIPLWIRCRLYKVLCKPNFHWVCMSWQEHASGCYVTATP